VKKPNPFNMENTSQEYEDMTYTVSKLSESLTMTEFKDAIIREGDTSGNEVGEEQTPDDAILNIEIRSPNAGELE
jgi:hypothetical protein